MKAQLPALHGPPFIIQLPAPGWSPLRHAVQRALQEIPRRQHLLHPLQGYLAERPVLGSDELSASPGFNAQTMCGTPCLQHKVNEALDARRRGEIELTTPAGDAPQHINSSDRRPQ